MTATRTAPLTAPLTPSTPSTDADTRTMSGAMTPTASASGTCQRLLLAAATVWAGIFAGFFLTYSASVVLGLGQVDDVNYVTSFQAINATIRNVTFAVMFFPTLPIAVLALIAHRRSDRVTRILVATATILIATVIAITFAGSVPLNNELATYVDVNATSAATARADFESTWNRLNLARSVAATAAVVALGAASFRTSAARPAR